MDDTDKTLILSKSLEVLLRHSPENGLGRIKELLEKHKFSDDDAKELFDTAQPYITHDPEVLNLYQILHKDRFGRIRMALVSRCKYSHHGETPIRINKERVSVPTDKDYFDRIQEKMSISDGICRYCLSEEMASLKGE